ncbi:MAG: hypothetical protein LCH58_16960 [Bacteroidetes bacterium]|uniref:hypothetical protein n=1 Tax=Phnomibacter sp. TaxID=2836217 RepID=UPI002FDC96E8|nr:hypothetical protein [Bacteroidota bacterium]
MKNFLLLMAVGCFCQVAFAQTAPIPEVNLDRYNKLRHQQQLAPLVQKRNQHQLPQGFPANIKQPNSVQLALSHTNALGEVYVLPQDKMPMLKPCFQDNTMSAKTDTTNSQVNLIWKISNAAQNQSSAFWQVKK